MNINIMKYFGLQRQIFGICPKCRQFFRLSDCKIFPKKKPVPDWMDKITKEEERLDRIEEKLAEKEEELREKARERGRQDAQLIARKIDPVFTRRKLNPDDAKVLFHPIDFIVFNGMKENKFRNIFLLDRHRAGDQALQESIRKVVERERYEWQTLRVSEEGKISVE